MTIVMGKHRKIDGTHKYDEKQVLKMKIGEEVK